MKIGVLLSVGAHPASGRPRPASVDLAALRLALRAGVPVVGLHAGEFDDALLDYGAYGLRELILIPAAVSGGRLPAETLAIAVKQAQLGMLLSGALGEAPESMGLLPYAVACALGWPVLSDVMQLSRHGGEWQAVTRLDATTRRRHARAMRSVLLAWSAGTEHMTYAAQQRARLMVRNADGSAYHPSGQPATRACAIGPHTPSLPQPVWTRPNPEDGAAARLRTLRGQAASAGGQVVYPPSLPDAAELVLRFLRRHGFRLPNDTGKDVRDDPAN